MTPEELGQHIAADFSSFHDTGGARTAYFVRLLITGGARTAYFVRLLVIS